MDEGFIRRTYRTSAWVLLLTVLYLMGFGAFQAAWSVAAGTGLALLVLFAFEWVVRGLFAPGRRPPNWLMLQVALVKLPLLSLVLYLVVHSGWFHLGAFAGGVALVHAVIFLKALGIYWGQVEEERKRVAG